ncbi:MAG: zinc-ribbon domain-containing transport protein [Candidatus Eremiobacteraeota bacterium]|nr:zinc-ribbon domain-containing transport protein [Candidatus Eremiobacteraeota bacterium]
MNFTFAIAVFVMGWWKVKAAMTDDAPRDVAPPDGELLSPTWGASEDVRCISETDPNFSETAFLAQAARTYEAALSAQAALDSSRVSSATTANFRHCLDTAIERLRDSGLIEHVSGLQFDPSHVVRVSIDGTNQVIVVRLSGSWVRYTADASTCILSSGSTQPQPFTEFVTFTRPAGTTTPKSIGAGGPSHCPGCGAPLQPYSVVCPFCGTPLTGTGATWLLDSVSATPYVA